MEPTTKQLAEWNAITHEGRLANSSPYDTAIKIAKLAYAAGADAARRPKPPSSKQQAISYFEQIVYELDGAGNYSNRATYVREALESLPD
jgi:hypothetical protein